ncbi:hypothetical protein NBE98_09515 [Clostridium swellfunianum]|uniref:hypothetical protein n=1 Tax=Clostridium swellfunianum TaxID=1367462 RepID=UPI00202E2B71|nr:hypothetical protein [Clostridium swellfunianum]MCM0648610.1 hypothetical protein [Clostridium swellfunianum]
MPELKPITISFKQTPEEIALYNIINQYSSKGAFIKDTLINVLIRGSVLKKSLFGAEIDELLEDGRE